MQEDYLQHKQSAELRVPFADADRKVRRIEIYLYR
jgi:hypothetical protein